MTTLVLTAAVRVRRRRRAGADRLRPGTERERCHHSGSNGRHCVAELLKGGKKNARVSLYVTDGKSRGAVAGVTGQ